MLRSLLTVLHRVHPSAFARVTDVGGHAAVSVASVDQLESALRADGGLPATIQVGNLRLQVAASATELTGEQAHVSGPLAGQVALVSGAASGLGLGVAKGLWKAGAAVVFTDVDAAGLAKVAEDLADPARVFTQVMNVTDESSVQAAYDAALTRFGRLDGIACCAGVAPAFALEDFPVDKWRLACEINLTGYFLMGREAARIMKPFGHGGWMVLLSSKSGLEPSKNNSVYNATKAGELHLARGWALELGRSGIRVNCIAPGNVFEGSKIWNPAYIAEAAKKKGIRPDEVIPHYIGLTALNRDIKPDDIANAAVYLASDAARCVTGQVLVVDAGQVWTR